MPLELREIDAEVDFPALARCLYESYEEPLQKFFYVWFPIFEGSENARKNSLDEAAERLAKWHTEDPSSYWQKVIDTETGNIAGAALWNIHKENPFAQAHDMEVTWFPDDGSRKFTEQMIELHSAPRALRGQRPHIYLFIIYTSPAYRRKGVGQQLMSWGIKKADEMGVEMFLDSTPMGRPLYEENGFVGVHDNLITPQTDTPDDAWKELEKKTGPVPFCLMWRPVGGKYEEGKTILPWENE
ncbi:acyl-CoA N-acyltransferase [Nemania sp. FL0031]|nr:acyl-CoA N-acyltransferase [Nemania sp. FL0031]